MAKREKDERGLSMQDLRSAMAEEHPERDAGLSAAMAMSSDTIEEQQPDGTYRFALNGVMEDRETTGRLQNEESNEECIDITNEAAESYIVYVTNCCGERIMLDSTDIDYIADNMSSFISGCDTFEYDTISVNENDFNDMTSAMQYIVGLGFGTYNVIVSGCRVRTHKLTVVDCCSVSYSEEIAHGAVINVQDYLLNYRCYGTTVSGYSVMKDGATIFGGIPFGAPLTLEIDGDIVITYICYNEGDECSIVQELENGISFYDTGVDYISGVDQYGNIMYYECDDCYVWFAIPDSVRPYIGNVIDSVAISSNLDHYPIMSLIDVVSNDISSHLATLFVDENDNSFIVVHLNGIREYESYHIKIGHLFGLDISKQCYAEFYVNDQSIIVIGSKNYEPKSTIVDVSKTDFGFTDKAGAPIEGLVGNYDGNDRIEAFIVYDGFGNRYVSKSNEMEINIYHNKKIELIYE